VKRLRKAFKELAVLDSIDFAVKKGTVLALLGPNGAGKTTTINILSTLLLPTPRPTITKDIQYLRQQDRENLQIHIQERLPQEYENCMAGINRVLQLTWEIAEKPTDDKTKLQAFAQLNEGYKFKMDLTTNGVVITDAIKYVTQKQEQIDTLQKIDERIEAIGEEDTAPTTNGVF